MRIFSTFCNLLLNFKIDLYNIFYPSNNTQMSKLTFITIRKIAPLLLISICLSYQSTSNSEEEKFRYNSHENFDKFINQFYTNKAFQLNRIKFPVECKIYNTENSNYKKTRLTK